MPANANRTDPHPVALLLPWYATGTLGSAERRLAEAHLAVCGSCREELANIQVLRSQLWRADGQDHHALPDFAFVTPVTARREVKLAALGAKRVARGRSARTRLTTAVLALILVQSGWLLWLTQARPFATGARSRAVPAPTAQFRLPLRSTAPHHDLQLLLSTMDAHIVSGPAPDGSHLVVMPDVDPMQVEPRLSQLRGHAELVSSAERVSP
jgi:hypothetical protein